MSAAMEEFGADTPTTALNRLKPRVALVGPKGSGKTVYREWLAASGKPPTWLQETLRTNPIEWRDSKIILPSPKGGWGWRSESLQPPVDSDDSFQYLYVADGSNFIARFTFEVPRIGRSKPVHLLDFPGEWWSIAEGDERWYPRHERDSLELLKQCRMIVLFAPFWMLIPNKLRPDTSPIDQVLQTKNDPLSAGRGASRKNRQRALVSSGIAWIRRLTNLIQVEKANFRLVVVLSMLGSDWPLEVRTDDPSAEPIVERLQRIRGLLSHRVAEFRPPMHQGPLQRWLPELARVSQAAAAKALLKDLDEEVREYLSICSELWTPGQSGYQFAIEFAALRDLLGPSKIHHIGMNVVSERFRIVEQAGARYNEYLRQEPSGAMLPLAYLLASVDELR
jgi:hypothetical protein